MTTSQLKSKLNEACEKASESVGGLGNITTYQFGDQFHIQFVNVEENINYQIGVPIEYVESVQIKKLTLELVELIIS